MSDIKQKFDTILADLTAAVGAQTGPVQSTGLLVLGFAKALEEAITTAKGAGATDAQMAAPQALHASLTDHTDLLSGAVSANPIPTEPA